MSGIGAFGSMGGMSAMRYLYQNPNVNRRQAAAEPAEETNLPTAEPAEKTGLPATQNAADAAGQQQAPAQATALPAVESLDNATETLSQMRVQFSDPADAAFERFQAENAQRSGGMLPTLPVAGAMGLS